MKGFNKHGNAGRRDGGFVVAMTLAIMFAIVATLAIGLVVMGQGASAAQADYRGASRQAQAVAAWQRAGLPQQAQAIAASASSASSDADASDEGESPAREARPATEAQPADEGQTDGDGQPAETGEHGAESGSEPADGDGQSATETDADPASAAAEAADSASMDAQEKTTLEKAIGLADGKHLFVRMEYGPEADVPADAQLSVVQVIQTPEGYDPDKPEFKGRPTETEQFVSEDQLKARNAQLAKAVDARDDDYVFYTAFLDVSIVSNGESVKPAAPVEVTLETDAVSAAESDALRVSFYTHVESGDTRAWPLATENRSGDAKRDKNYEKGAKIAFETEQFSELGLAGVATPHETWQAEGYAFTLYGPGASSVWKEPASVGELPEGVELVEAFGLAASTGRPYGTTLWLAAKAASDSEAVQQPVACYALESGVLGSCLLEGAADAPAAVKAGDAVALVMGAPADAAEARGLAGSGVDADEAEGESSQPESEGAPQGLSAFLAAKNASPSLGSSVTLAATRARLATIVAAADTEPADESVTAKWVDDDGTTVLTVETGTAPFTPVYGGQAPTKTPTAQYTYEFIGWTSSLDTSDPKTIIDKDATAFPAVSEDVVYTAVYKATVNTYTITWKNYDDSVLETDEGVEYGTTPTYDGATPTRLEGSDKKYSFSYWDPNPEPVTGDAVYKACYTEAPVEFLIEDYSTRQPFAGATLTLTNVAGAVVWSGTTNANGVLSIPRVEAETADGGGAVFANGSSYTLTQTATDSSHYSPEGSWTLFVSDEGAFSCAVHPASASDLTTRAASGPYGIRFYLYNVASSNITYDYNYPASVSDQPVDKTSPLPNLGYSVSYTVPEDDPSIAGYEFVGWAVDGTTRTVKKGATISLDTVNVREHAMVAIWRNPLNVVAKTYYEGDSSHATDVAESADSYQVADEKSMTFASLSEVCEAYGEQNAAVQDLNAKADFEFVFAQIANGPSSTRISALQYDAGVHAWQYKKSGDSNWVNVEQGDELQLYYTSELVSVQWVMEAEDGSFTSLDTTRFPNASAIVGGEWVSVADLVAAADRPVVHGLGYFRSYGIGPSSAIRASELDKSGLASFSLRNSEDGFLFRQGASGDGELLENSAIFLVYSETPPDGSAYLDIANNTAWPYKASSLLVGSSAENDLLGQGKVVLVGENNLLVMKPDDTVVPGGRSQLVLLDAGPAPFALGGGFEESAAEGTVVSASVAGTASVTRTALVKEAGSNPLANTADVTRGTLEAAPAKVVVTFDSNLRDLTITKSWSDDSYPEHYQVDFALYEDGVRCTTDTASPSGYYVVSPDEWALVIPSLPARCSYNVVEQAVRRVSGSNTTADETDKFKASYDSTSEENVIAVSNTRSSAVCQVGGQKFTTIKAAVDYIVEHDMRTGATIEMFSDYIMAESGSVTIPAGFDIALTTVAGETAKTVTRGFSGVSDMFCVNGQLSITNLTLTGKLDNALLAKSGNGAFVVVDGADAKLTAGVGSVFMNGKAENGSAIYAQNGATVNLAGARITANRAASGGAVGVADANCRITLSGDTYVFDNRDGDNYGNYNIYLDQDSNEVIQVVNGGLGSDAKVGVYVPNGESSALYNAHGAPAKPFATYDNATKANLENANLSKIVSNRLGSAKNNFGCASTILDDTVVWGETFSFTAKKQWLDEHFNVIAAPGGATSTLRLTGGSTTPDESVKTTVTLDGTEGWTCTFTGLAKYDGSGKPYEYRLVESGIPADYKQVTFTGDKATTDNPLTYSDETGDEQVAIVSNYYRYTTLTVNKEVSPTSQGLKSTFAVYGVPKNGADLSRSVRLGGVGGVNDLPLALRGGVSNLGGIAEDGLFYTEEGGNSWYTKVGGETVKFHAFYDAAFYGISGDGSGSIVVGGVTPQAGDVAHPSSSGYCSVYDGSAWHTLAKSITTSYISFSRQDGVGGVESVGGTAMGKSCTIDCSGSSAGTYTFDYSAKLSSDYDYYVIETTVQETGSAARTISGSHKIVATYDPVYSYDQLTQTVNVKNVRQDYLSVDKIWPEDAASYGECVFDVYKVDTGSGLGTVAYLGDAASFKALVKANYETWVADGTATQVGTASLPEADTGSWVHVFKDIGPEDLASNVYFVRERSAGGVAILNPDVSDSSTAVDAVYGYDDKVNQITVHNMSDVLCKVVDGDGTEHPFRTLNDALAYGRTRTTGDSNTEFTIEMLRDYSIPASDVMTLAYGEDITLTTASTTAGTYRYKGGDESATRATITRKAGNTWSFIRLNGDAGDVGATTVTLRNLALDGSGVQVGYKIGNTTYRHGSFVYATNATVVLEKGGEPAQGVEMRNALGNYGGAVYAEASNVYVSDAAFVNCQASDGAWHNPDNGGGGAIWTSGTSTVVKDSTFAGCTSKRHGGALLSWDATTGSETVVSGCTFTSCEASYNGGAVYSRNDTLSVGGVTAGAACTFTGCTAGNRGGGVAHATSQAGSVTSVDACTFSDCKTTGGGEGQGDQNGGGGLNSLADTLNLTRSTFTACNSYTRGGGVAHFNFAATDTNVSDCVFDACTTTRSGGGAMHVTGFRQTISRCDFTDCEAKVSAGGGVDVGSWKVEKDTTFIDCTFTRCIAGGAEGGGICAGGKTLTVIRCAFDECEAPASNGGGVSAGVTDCSLLELDIYGCTFKDCTALGGSGGAICSKTAITRIGDDPSDSSRHTTIVNCQAKNTGGAVYHSLRSVDEQLEASLIDIANSVFDTCSTRNGSGGAVYTNALKSTVSGIADTPTFKDCTSQTEGGAFRHERNAVSSVTTLVAVSFDSCRSVNGNGGGVWANTAVADFTDASFKDCQARSTGGAVYHALASDGQVPVSSAALRNCAFENCSTDAYSSGGMYTTALVATVEETTFKGCTAETAGGGFYHSRGHADAKTTLTHVSFEDCSANKNEGGALRLLTTVLTMNGVSFANCKAKTAGGAVYQQLYNASYVADAKAILTDCSFADCSASNGSGGAFYTQATKLSMTDSDFANCTARSSAGGVQQGIYGGYVSFSDAVVTGCTFENCTAETQNAGALYSNALTLSVAGVDGTPTFHNCSSYNNAGAVFHDRNSEPSKTTLANCSFEKCRTENSSGGAVTSWATKLDLKDCSFAECAARYTGGAVQHSVNGNYVGSSDASVVRCTFADCSATQSHSGALYSNAQTLGITGQVGVTTFENCTSSGYGGAVYHERNNWEAAKTTLKQCSFKACESKQSRGGAVCTNVPKLDMSDFSFADCIARGSGGAVCHSVNNSYLSSSESLVSHGSFTNCESATGNAGALYSEALAITVNGGSGKTSFTNCKAALDGGAFYQYRSNEGSTVTISDCDFNICTSMYPSGSNRGGAAYINARQLAVVGSSFNTCIAKGNGGCLVISPNVNAANTATITNSTFTGGISQTGAGGAIYAYRSQLALVGTFIANSTAASNGGGLYFEDGEGRPATIDGCTIVGNSAKTYGGGVYFSANAPLTLRNGTIVTENAIGNATVENAAGIYMHQGRSSAVLVLGSEGVDSDTITVFDNKTSAGDQSNVRLIAGGQWKDVNGVRRYDDKHGDLNDTTMVKYSVNLLSNLEKPDSGAVGIVGVANPGAETTRFGLGDVGYRTGVEYIRSDIDTLVGKIDGADLEGRRLIWYAPPVCKITDQYGRMLTYDNDKAATFSTLAAAYAVANNLTAGYIIDDNGVTPSQIQIQMLVADYPLEASMPALQRDITLTTATAGPGEFDYPLNASSPWCTIRRGASVTGSMFTAASGKTFTVSSITLDGGDSEASPRVMSVDGGIINGQVNSVIVLSENAMLQNSAVSEYNRGGAVFVTGGSDDSVPALIMERNATIQGCSAGDGGGVYLTGGVLFRMNDAPHIEGCSASGAGGAVYVSPYATMSFFDNPNGVIRGNYVTSIDGEGAGIYLPSNDSKLLLQLGGSADISGNYVAGSYDPDRLNGADSYPVLYQDIYLGESAEPVTSITLVGNVSLPEGSVYVWARNPVHYKTEMQFAVVATNADGSPAFPLLEASLAAFRNARDDVDSENDTDTYLYGLTDDGVNVIWSYNAGSAKVILRKVGDVGGRYQSLPGATFTVYKGRSTRPYVVRHEDGTRETLSGLTSGENGVFWIGNLPFGTYYLNETAAPFGYSAGKWFKLTVDENGVVMSRSAASRSAL